MKRKRPDETRPAPGDEPSAIPAVSAPDAGASAIGEPLAVWERWAWRLLLFVSLALRLFQLGERPFHHDESIHAWFAWNFLEKGEYKYDPVYHGPVQYGMVALGYIVWGVLAKAWVWLTTSGPETAAALAVTYGDNDFSARMPAAVGGVVLSAMALLLRPRLGRVGALCAGALVAFSPTLLYFTRFCREDIWSLLGTCGMLLYWDAWKRTGRLRYLAYTALGTAVAFAAKENCYVLGVLVIVTVLTLCYRPEYGLDFWGAVRKTVDFLERHTVALGGALCLFFVVSELLYTVLLIHTDSGNPILQAVTYWYGQHKVERVSGPKTYHLPRLALYELAILLPAVLHIVRRLRDLVKGEGDGPSAYERFLFVLGILSIAMYAYLGEKTPWLILHQTFPFIPLAAAWWASVLEDTRTADGRAGLLALARRTTAVVLAPATVISALSLSFWLPSLTPAVNKAEPVIYVQTTPEALEVVREAAALELAGADPSISVEGEANWPYSWYLRHAKVVWGHPTEESKAAIVIVDEGKVDETHAVLGPAWRWERMPLRAWWVPDRKPTFGQLLKYVLTREVWPEEWGNGIGAQYVAVFRRVSEEETIPVTP